MSASRQAGANNWEPALRRASWALRGHRSTMRRPQPASFRAAMRPARCWSATRRRGRDGGAAPGPNGGPS
eukprot:15441267-Alexandrium_andersonii.AAC.1